MALKVLIPLLVAVAAGVFACDYVNKKKKKDGEGDTAAEVVDDITAAANQAASDVAAAAKKTAVEVKAAVPK